MIKKLLENTEYAVENNEMKEFLMGKGKYFIPERETLLPNYSAHSVSWRD